MSKTPTGGAQMFFEVPADFPHTISAGELAEDIDTRCNGWLRCAASSHGDYTKRGMDIVGDWKWVTTDPVAPLRDLATGHSRPQGEEDERWRRAQLR